MKINLNEIKHSIFPGGEVHVCLDIDTIYRIGEAKEIFISADRISSSDEVMKLLLVTDAIRNCSNTTPINLTMNYVPYGRQDRVCVPGESLSIKVFSNLINSQNYKEVLILDPHSDVTPALINNCSVLNNHYRVYMTLRDISGDVTIISPDAGANKKTKDLVKSLYNYNEKVDLVKCDKTRDLKTGKISGFEVYADDLEGKTCVIVDDICDGGGTFLGLAKELQAKNAGDLHLIVSHGIFSKGLDELNKYFKTIKAFN